MNQASQTRHSLLQRAASLNDEQAWNELEKTYRHFILHILIKLNVVPDDIEDLTQQILLVLTKDLQKYDRNRGSFRAWLATIIRNKTYTYFRKRIKNQEKLEEFSRDSHFEAPPIIENLIEKEWATYIANLAMERVRKSFRGHAMDAFERFLDGHTASEVAAETGLTIASVYTLKKRVTKKLYLEIRSLTAELES